MLLQIEGLRVYFHTRRGVVKAVDGVDLAIGARESVALVGESGSGKSTVAFSIMRLIQCPPGKIEGGQILFNDRDLLTLPNPQMRAVAGKEIAMVFQDPMTYLNPVMTIGDQIAETLRQHGVRDNVEEDVRRALRAVRMPDPDRVLKSYPHQLSGGMKQRVLISMAVVRNPSLLIADEPTTALDVTVQAQILALIRDLKDQLGTALLLITHDLGIVAETCDRVYVMYAGQIVEQANVLDLFEDPKHPYTRGLLKSVLSIDEFKETLEGIPGTVPDLISPPSGCRFSSRCPEATPRCTASPPPPFDIREGTKVYCWMYET